MLHESIMEAILYFAPFSLASLKVEVLCFQFFETVYLPGNELFAPKERHCQTKNQFSGSGWSQYQKKGFTDLRAQLKSFWSDWSMLN